MVHNQSTMIPLLTREAVRAVDADAIERLGIPGHVLMENAGRGAAEALLERFEGRLGRVVIVGGIGQNGGDAWVVARHLFLRGIQSICVLVGDEARVRGDAAMNLAALRPLGVEFRAAAPDALGPLQSALEGATLVVDGLFGTGLDRPLRGGYAAAVERIVDSGVPCAALDLPSGVDADTGAILGVATRAELTITFAARKRGLFQYPGTAHAGEVRCAHIGVPLSGDAPMSILEPADVARLVPPRRPDAHKGTAGHVLVVGGSPGHGGAALLSGLGAMRAGAGLVTLAVREDAQASLDARVRELMTDAFPRDGATEAVLAMLEGKSSAVIGPGLGLDAASRELCRRLAESCPVPAVLDADALTAVAEVGLKSLRDAAAPRVLTPHPGEAGRLLGVSTQEIQADRHAAAEELARLSHQVVVLKGAGSIACAPDGRGYVCARGTPAMGVAGTGDVLAGAIGALLSELSPLEAAGVGVTLHALAGEASAESDRGLLSGELADAIPAVLDACRGARER